MAYLMRLGGYKFPWNPDRVSPIDYKKTVAVEETYNGSAIFLWPAFLEGTQVVMSWKWMSETQFQALRTLYLTNTLYTWQVTGSVNYAVYVMDLEGQYFETVLMDASYREEVRMRLSIRATAEAPPITTTTV